MPSFLIFSDKTGVNLNLVRWYSVDDHARLILHFDVDHCECFDKELTPIFLDAIRANPRPPPQDRPSARELAGGSFYDKNKLEIG